MGNNNVKMEILGESTLKFVCKDNEGVGLFSILTKEFHIIDTDMIVNILMLLGTVSQLMFLITNSEELFKNLYKYIRMNFV